MLAQSILEYGGLATVAEQVQFLGYELSSWIRRAGRQEFVIVGAALTGLLVVLRLVRAR